VHRNYSLAVNTVGDKVSANHDILDVQIEAAPGNCNGEP
jgi:hypothetical protein